MIKNSIKFLNSRIDRLEKKEHKTSEDIEKIKIIKEELELESLKIFNPVLREEKQLIEDYHQKIEDDRIIVKADDELKNILDKVIEQVKRGFFKEDYEMIKNKVQ